MKFSVLMSVYGKDNPTFFKAALESVSIKQTVKPNQIVVVKDGPVPEEIDNIIIDLQGEAGNIEFTVIGKEKNAGLAAALNTGLSYCKYDWVARMDSDDISVPERFQRQISFLSKHPDIEILGGAIAEFESIPGDLESRRYVALTHNDITKMAKTRTPMNHVSVFYLKASVAKAGNYTEDFGKLEDYKLWVDLLVSGAKFANLKDILVYVRVGNGFIKRRSNKREIVDWDMLQEYLLKAKIINNAQALMNKLYIRTFIYIPSWTKKVVYKTLLRK